MWSDEEAEHKCQTEGGGEADEHRLRELSDGGGVYSIEYRGSDDSGQRMQQPRRTKQLASLLMWYMFGQR